jgi:hypothetical protein
MPVVTQTGQFGLALLVLVDQPDLVLSEQFVVQQGGIMRSQEQLIACLRGAAGHATLALMGEPFSAPFSRPHFGALHRSGQMVRFLHELEAR